MTREEQNRITIQSLQAGGVSEQMARDIVARSLKDLKDKGISHPTDMPWSKKMENRKIETIYRFGKNVIVEARDRSINEEFCIMNGTSQTPDFIKNINNSKH